MRSRLACLPCLVVALAALAITLIETGSTRVHLRTEMSQECSRCGLDKLTDAELTALESWLARRTTAPPPSRGLEGTSRAPMKNSAGDRLVTFNVSSHKYHHPSCRHARQCTRHCIEIALSQALERGGVPCQACGGGH